MGVLSSLFLLASLQSAAEPLPALIHNFGDWVVSCDNGLRCQALSLAPVTVPTLAGQEPAPNQAELNSWDVFGVMRMEREAGPDARLVITVSDFEGTPAKLIQYGSPREVRFEKGEGEEWRVIPADQNDFLGSFFDEPLVIQDAAGKTLAWIAGAGARNALGYMDERQGRVRTTTALIHSGPRPASVVPAAPPLPVVDVAPPTRERPLNLTKAELSTARRQHGCATSDVGGLSETQELYALGNGRTLIMMSCGAGAYNFNSKPLIAWREGGRLRVEEAKVDVALQGFDGEKPQFLVTNSDFDPATMRIAGFAKGRGLGDCGVSEHYAWDGERFRLVEQHEMSECRGTQDLLTTWRAETR